MNRERYNQPEVNDDGSQERKAFCSRWQREVGRRAVSAHMSDVLPQRATKNGLINSFFRDFFSDDSRVDLLLMGEGAVIASPPDPVDVRRSVEDSAARETVYHYSVATEESVTITDSPFRA